MNPENPESLVNPEHVFRDQILWNASRVRLRPFCGSGSVAVCGVVFDKRQPIHRIHFVWGGGICTWKFLDQCRAEVFWEDISKQGIERYRNALHNRVTFQQTGGDPIPSDLLRRLQQLDAMRELLQLAYDLQQFASSLYDTKGLLARFEQINARTQKWLGIVDDPAFLDLVARARKNAARAGGL
jgi:hypothetical protein